MHSLKAICLGSLAHLYGAVSSARNWLYDMKLLPIYRSKLRVISVGNLTAGGNGKTPFCIYLAQFYAAHGKRPVIVSRGYGARINEPHLVSKDDHVEQVGDEPLMMARLYDLKVVVCPSRREALKLVEREDLGDVVVLDDGFQHRGVARDLDIVCVNCASDDAIKQFNAGELLPLGRFREVRASGLKRAQVLVLARRGVKSDQSPPLRPLLRDLPAQLRVVESALASFEVVEVSTGKRLEPCKINLFCAIANPEGLLAALAAAGFAINKSFLYPDHFVVAGDELSRLLGVSGDVPLVCTEKDLVRLDNAQAEKLFVARSQTRLGVEIEKSLI